jgi:hypothetical protein
LSLFCVNTAVVAIQPQQDVLLPELNSVPPIVHGSFIPSQDVHAFGEGKRTLTAGGHSGHQAVWPAPSSRRTSLSDCVPLFSSKRPSAGDRFAKRPAEAPSIPHWDCRRIDGSLLRIAQYRRCRDRPPQMSGSSPALRRGSNRPLCGGNYGYIFKFAHSSSPCRPSLSSLYILLLELLECKPVGHKLRCFYVAYHQTAARHRILFSIIKARLLLSPKQTQSRLNGGDRWE